MGRDFDVFGNEVSGAVVGEVLVAFEGIEEGDDIFVIDFVLEASAVEGVADDGKGKNRADRDE